MKTKLMFHCQKMILDQSQKLVYLKKNQKLKKQFEIFEDQPGPSTESLPEELSAPEVADVGESNEKPIDENDQKPELEEKSLDETLQKDPEEATSEGNNADEEAETSSTETALGDPEEPDYEALTRETEA